jgi:hypothetical protein
MPESRQQMPESRKQMANERGVPVARATLDATGGERAPLPLYVRQEVSSKLKTPESAQLGNKSEERSTTTFRQRGLMRTSE